VAEILAKEGISAEVTPKPLMFSSGLVPLLLQIPIVGLEDMIAVICNTDHKSALNPSP
jgi:hypothetical protein